MRSMEIMTLVCSMITCLFAILACFMAWKASRSHRASEDRVVLEKKLLELRGDIVSTQQTTVTQTAAAAANLISGLDNRMANQARNDAQLLEAMRNTIDEKLNLLRTENNKQLDEIKKTVDEKLQSTLEERISRSFKTVSERLEEVYKGLGEMKNLAVGVGDLKKVLSNVKTRGILGEIQLEAILSEILSPEQYETNIATVPGSRNVVEFAIRLPGGDDGAVYMPIDSKFPLDPYQNLLNARDLGEAAQIQAATNALTQRLKSEAKDIHEKYISPPHTTDFGILFLPIEGLYAEVVQLGMVEELQRSYRINIAGPTTMAALLNSLQMGFRTLAVQKRSVDVWNVLGAVKTEFMKFEQILTSTQKKLDAAYKDLDTLVGTRTRVINRKLQSVTALSLTEADSYLHDTAAGGMLESNEEEI